MGYCIFCLVFFHGLNKGIEYLLSVFMFFHIYKIYYYDTAEVPEPYLVSYFLYCLEISFEYCVFEFLFADKLAGIYIYDHHCLCLVNNYVTAGFQPDSSSKSPRYVKFDSKRLEYWLGAFI